jgi:inner membrane protein
MPTIISHSALPLALGLALGRGQVPARLVARGVFASILPDIDVLGFRLGIPYGDPLGHRGASHSLLAAALIGLASATAWRFLGASAVRVFLFILVAAASHGLFDALTNGGHGVALLWPWSAERYFAPVRPVEVSPIGLSRFFSDKGLFVIASEVSWIWLPCFAVAIAIREGIRRRGDHRYVGTVNR